MVVTSAGHIADGRTWLEPEEWAYSSGGFLRKGFVKLRRNPHNPIALPYGELRKVRVSIADTFFTIPARLRYQGKTVAGFVSKPEGEEELCFTPEAQPESCTVCKTGEGCRKS